MWALSWHLFSLFPFFLILSLSGRVILFLDILSDERFLVRAECAGRQRLRRSSWLSIIGVAVLSSLRISSTVTITNKLWQEDIEVFFFEFVGFGQDFVETFPKRARYTYMWHLIVKFLKDETHRPWQSAQVIILPAQSIVEGWKIGHPFWGKTAVENVDFVEKDE